MDVEEGESVVAAEIVGVVVVAAAAAAVANVAVMVDAETGS